MKFKHSETKVSICQNVSTRCNAQGGRSWAFEIFEKREGSDFSHKKGGVGKIGWGGVGQKRGGGGGGV